MDPLNLKTASTYINNLLLTRGLLRNGKPIEFARPHKADGGTDATMAEIINLVHDMILRRDREQEQRDRLSETLRASCAESASLTAAASKHAAALATAERAAAAAEAQVRAARAAAARAEGAAKALRDEAAKARAALARARASAAADVRRRDAALQRLKAHLAGQQRGAAPRAAAAGLVVAPGSLAGGSRGAAEEDAAAAERRAEEALRRETTEFLTKLSQGLSDENDGLIGLVRGALATLREMQGLPHRSSAAAADSSDAMDEGDGADGAGPASVDALAADMDHLLGSLRAILTSPDFVPVEEVSARDEEIAKLRAGWEKMEVKWREAIQLMDGWRRRMADGGGVNLDDIKRGLGLGRGLDIKDVGVLEDDSSDEGEGEVSEHDGSTGSLDDLMLAFSADSSAPTEPDFDGEPARALVEGSGNRSPRKVTFTADERHRRHAFGTGAADKNAVAPSHGMAAKAAPAAVAKKASPSPRLTVQEKLNVAQAEAEAAAVAAGLRLEDVAAAPVLVAAGGDRKPVGVRKTRVSGRPRRRKSTLTPDELERLMVLS